MNALRRRSRSSLLIADAGGTISPDSFLFLGAMMVAVGFASGFAALMSGILRCSATIPLGTWRI